MVRARPKFAAFKAKTSKFTNLSFARREDCFLTEQGQILAERLRLFAQLARGCAHPGTQARRNAHFSRILKAVLHSMYLLSQLKE